MVLNYLAKEQGANMGKVASSNLSMTLPRILLSWVTCAGLAGGVWLTQVAIAPSAAQAYTARVDVTLDRRAGETYETLLRRAEIAARAAAQRGFDRDILATQVSVIVSAQSEGSVVPVLTLDVSRNQWRGRPDPQRWATYFRSSQALLNLQRLPAAEANSQAAPPPAPFVPSQPNSLPPAPNTLPSTPIPPGIGVPSQAAPTTNGGAGRGTTPGGTNTTPPGAGTATPAGPGTTGTGTTGTDTAPAGTGTTGTTGTGTTGTDTAPAGTGTGTGTTPAGSGTGTQSQPVLTTPGGQRIIPPTQPAGTTPTGTQPTNAPTTGTGTTPTGTQPTNTPATGTGTTPAGATQSSPTITAPGGQPTTVPTTQPGTTNNVPSNSLPSTTIR